MKALTAYEIRQLPVIGQPGEEDTEVCANILLREIAAQLAEIQNTLKEIAGKLNRKDS